MARFSLPDELPDAFTVGEAFALGASERRLRGANLDAPFRGARILSATDDEPDAEDAAALWERRRSEHLRLMRAYAPVLAQGGFFCGPSAAVAWRIPIPQRLWPSDVHVGAHRPKRAPRRPDVRGYQFTRGFIHLAALEELPITDAASTWATLGRDLYENELVAAADRVLRVPRHPGGFKPVTEQPLASRRELEMRTERKGRPGAPALRGALDLARTGSSSPPETQVRLLLREFTPARARTRRRRLR